VNAVSSQREPVDLTNCDREPIHVPGSIQPHGVLLAMTEPGLRIVQASDSAETWLAVPAAELLGASLESALGSEAHDEVRRALASADPRADSPIRLVCAGREHDGILHRSGPFAVLELEPTTDGVVTFAQFHARVRSAITRLHKAERVVELCEHATREVAAMTGFDRVMAYRFDRDDHGHVIAEHRRDGLESYLDLHYPASDIPAQARRLYTVNWLRLIVDARYAPSPLLASPEHAAEPLDLTFSVLRSVSPIHCEYLHNMGIRASMSVSLVIDGRLWGMIICHHYAPRHVRYELRAACELLGQALSWQIAARERADAAERRAGSQRLLARLHDQIASVDDLAGSITGSGEGLLGLVDARGAGVRIGGAWRTTGKTPAPADLDALATPLLDHAEHGVVATDALSTLVPGAERHDATASGALAVTLSGEGDLVVWFRPEVVQTVSWAGDPRKLVSLADGEPRLTPRGSFALWRETVRHRSLPWQPWEIEAAGDLRRAVVGRVMRRNAELERRVEQRTAEVTAAHDAVSRYASHLAESNAELERFAYVASHDLQEPLRMIVSYLQLLARRYVGNLDQDADEFIGFAVDGAKRMQTLINDLLAFSRVGRQDRPPVAVDMESTFARVVANLEVAANEARAEITHDPLPDLVGDRSQLGQVLQNLVANALKFRGDAPARIHVGARRGDREWTIAVRDHGIGVPPEHAERIFVIFQRLHTRAEYEGSGVGLAICKKIVERHGGRIGVESHPGDGATFWFSIPDREAAS
jgi:chemotaxis family two-component system sensor kinase Cph1